MSGVKHQGAGPGPPHPATAWLYAGFLFTGSLTVLLGLLLPRIATRHHLTDSESGVLLLIQFATCASGALLVRRHFERTLMRGFALITAGAGMLMLRPETWAALGIGVGGLGLGMAMTSTSMLVGRIFPASRGSALSLLNLCWSIGAFVCPVVVARLPASFSLVDVCAPVAALSAGFVVLLWPSRMATSAAQQVPADDTHPSRRGVIVLFAVIGFLYVGTESALGAWMSTYASRAVAWNFTRSNLAAACFWGALLLGRALAPAALRMVSEVRLYPGLIAGASVGIVLLLEAHSPWVLLAGACCAGLALAPVFPLTISLFLARAGETRNAGWVFAIAGFGAAVMPWMTGVVSSDTHSLRTGLMVTLAADLAMLLVALLTIPSPWTARPRGVPARAQGCEPPANA
ncbi:MAG TPA: MFS transporter [Acidobacteriaceae bacterium]|jgi:fucose permease|nr:MFS transporter [Acidobacteriaceae bacterium]